jgi:hypothetical protein
VLLQADVDKWLGSASTIEHESKAWVDPFASAGDFSDEVSLTGGSIWKRAGQASHGISSAAGKHTAVCWQQGGSGAGDKA